jgi:hypothetical protein
MRDNARLLHPSLVPFEALSVSDREKDRVQVRAMLEVLGQEGRVVVRGKAGGLALSVLQERPQIE